MELVQQPQYIKPYPQQALDGDLGLTDVDIAKGLGVEVRHVRQKIQRGNYANCPELRMSVFEDFNENGVLVKRYVATEMAAKAFVARWVNRLGDGYLVYLLSRDEQMTRVENVHLPKLKDHIARLESQVAALIQAGTRKVRERRTWAWLKVPEIHLTMKDLFGEYRTEIIYRNVPYEDAKDPERRQKRIEQRSKIMKGLAASQDLDIEEHNRTTLTLLKESDDEDDSIEEKLLH